MPNPELPIGVFNEVQNENGFNMYLLIDLLGDRMRVSASGRCAFSRC
jgi:hypothetical protein